MAGFDETGDASRRTLLASERTLLAWLRTGLALVAGGVAVAEFAPDLGVRWGSAAVAFALVLTGAAAAIGGYLRWRRNEQAIAEDRPLPPGRALPALVAAVAAVLVVVTVLVGVEVLAR